VRYKGVKKGDAFDKGEWGTARKRYSLNLIAMPRQRRAAASQRYQTNGRN